MTPAEYFATAIRAPPPVILLASCRVAVRAPRGQPGRATYTLRRKQAPPLYLTGDLLACFYDLTIRQTGWALQACDTAIKRLRLWAREDAWPCREVRLRSHPVHTLESVRADRRRLLEATREAQPEMHAALLRAEQLAGGPGPAADALPADWLDRLDDAVAAEACWPDAAGAEAGVPDRLDEAGAVAGVPDRLDEAVASAIAAEAAQEAGGLCLFDANAFEIAPDDPFWDQFCQ